MYGAWKKGYFIGNHHDFNAISYHAMSLVRILWELTSDISRPVLVDIRNGSPYCSHYPSIFLRVVPSTLGTDWSDKEIRTAVPIFPTAIMSQSVSPVDICNGSPYCSHYPNIFLRVVPSSLGTDWSDKEIRTAVPVFPTAIMSQSVSQVYHTAYVVEHPQQNVNSFGKYSPETFRRTLHS